MDHDPTHSLKIIGFSMLNPFSYRFVTQTEVADFCLSVVVRYSQEMSLVILGVPS